MQKLTFGDQQIISYADQATPSQAAISCAAQMYRWSRKTKRTSITAMAGNHGV